MPILICLGFTFAFTFSILIEKKKHSLQIFKRSVMNHGSTAKNDSKQVFIALDFFFKLPSTEICILCGAIRNDK